MSTAVSTAAKDPVRRHVAVVIGTWWRRHAPLGKRLLAALLVRAKATDATHNGAKTAAAHTTQVAVVWAGTGAPVAHQYALPSTGFAAAVVDTMRRTFLPRMDAGQTLQLFCGHGGPKLHPLTDMSTFEWPLGHVKELVLLRTKQFTGLLRCFGRTNTHCAVHTATNTIVSLNPPNSRVAVVHGGEVVPLKWCGGSGTHVDDLCSARHSRHVQSLTFSTDGSVIICVYNYMARFFAISTGTMIAEVHFSAAPNTTVTVASAATATKDGTGLRTTDTLLCVFDPTTVCSQYYFVVVAATDLSKPPQSRFSVCRAPDDNHAVSMSAVVVTGADGVPIGVCASYRGPCCGGPGTSPYATHINLVCLRTAETIRTLSIADGKTHVLAPACDCRRSFWTCIDNGRIQRMQLTDGDGALVVKGPAFGVNARKTTCRQIPHRTEPSILLSTESNAYIVDNTTRHVAYARQAWPLSDGERIIVRGDSLCVINL